MKQSNPCSEYDRASDYSYNGSTLEPCISEQLGAIYSPYSGQCFTSLKQTEIEHIVAIPEAHDSGLCAYTVRVRRAFASDLDNLTLVSRSVNGQKKTATPPDGCRNRISAGSQIRSSR